MRTAPRSRGLALVSSVLAIVSSALLAQTTGQIRGTVTDAHGEGLPGATVEVFSPSLQGTRSTVSGAGGSFQLPSLAPGNYRVVVSLAGFAKAEQQTQVRLDATANVAVSLQVVATEQIVVTGETPIVDLNTATGEPATRRGSSTGSPSDATTPTSCSRTPASRRTAPTGRDARPR